MAGVALDKIVPCLDIVLQVVAGTLATAEQVSCVEGVVHVPANPTGRCRQIAYPKLLPLQQGSMEVAQGKDDGTVLSLHVTAVAEDMASGFGMRCQIQEQKQCASETTQI